MKDVILSYRESCYQAVLLGGAWCKQMIWFSKHQRCKIKTFDFLEIKTIK